MFAFPETLQPTVTGSGPNIYLSAQHFRIMLAAAFCLHLLAMMVSEMIPQDTTLSVPVRVLNVKLSDDAGAPTMQLSSFLEPKPEPKPEPAPLPMIKPEAPKPEPAPKAVTDKPVEKAVPLVPAVKPEPKPKPPVMQAKPQPKPEPKTTPPLPALPKVQDPSLTQKRIPVGNLAERSVSQSLGVIARSQSTVLVRENALPSPAAAAPDPVQSAAQAEVVARYEQMISSWIEKHKVYPEEARALGLRGKAVVRIRIDRQGNIRFFALDEATGSPVLDSAVVKMLQQANPVPPVPADYPAGNLIEFLIPVSFYFQ